MKEAVKDSESFAKWMFCVALILFVCGFALQQHHLAQDKRRFAMWRSELLSQDWIMCEREQDHKQLDLTMLRVRLESAKSYDAHYAQTAEEGEIVIFTRAGEVPIHYEIYTKTPETVVIYNDDFGFWSIGKREGIGL